MRKLTIFLSMDREFRLLLLESYFYLAWARVLKNIPFPRVAPSLGVQMQETSYNIDSAKKFLLGSVSEAIHITSRYTFWESECLVKAIAAMKILEKRKIESTLYLGIAKDESGNLIAHAWLRSGPFYITGAEGMEKFTVVSKFAKKLKKE